MLIVGQTGCQKTMFTQNLAKNKLLGKLKNVFWLTKIELSKDREQNIATSFHGIPLRFLYPWTSDDFNMHLDFFSKGKGKSSSVMSEKNIFNKLIVMDNVHGLAGRSSDFANFLTVRRKFNFTPVYIFHTIYPSRCNWQMKISQTKIFHIFSGSLQTT